MMDTTSPSFKRNFGSFQANWASVSDDETETMDVGVSSQARLRRLAFFKVNEDTRRVLRDFWPYVAAEMVDIRDGFAGHLGHEPSLLTMVGSDAERVLRTLTFHLESLLTGSFDDKYFDQVIAIGRVHHRIGLDPVWYIGSYNYVLTRLIALASRQPGWSDDRKRDAITAVTSAILLDMELAISVFVGSVIELENLKREANIAKEAGKQTARVLSGLPATVYSGVLSAEGRVVEFNIRENAKRVSGRENSEIASWEDWGALTAGITPEDWQSHFAKVASDGEAVIEYDLRHASGTILRCRDQARVIEARPNGDVEIVGYVSDVTRDHQIRAQAVQSAKLATLGEMATGLAHEMNQPIATMSLAAENSLRLLADKGADGIPNTITRLERIKQQAQRARTIIDHLRIFGGKNQDGQESFQLNDAVAGALSLVGGALRADDVYVENRMAPDLPVVTGGLILAEHVAVNLMLNARDAMADNPAGMPRTITIDSSVDEDEGTVTLRLTDTGPGIPDGLRERVFEPFFTTKPVGKGTGLGLPLCHGIMTSFGGSIAIENTQDGAQFVLTFKMEASAALAGAVKAIHNGQSYGKLSGSVH
jgi:signal transduction histidine kinase